ncbi:MAG: DUF3887 domain-containing protein [Spirochaetes bacterium]|jgi:hypothetical protein|nr:DUF3887 domain-containing protein [Spirochaetota bacterium]
MKKALPLFIMAFLVFAVTACKKSITGAERDAVLSYSEAIADGLLKGYNNGDYALYSKDFDEQMKNALNEKVFKQTRDLIASKTGKYVSRKLSDVYRQNQMIVIIYDGKFEKEDKVEIKLVLQKFGDKNLVSGLWFNSPKLRQ